ncbi:O-antigen ligase family protein [Candidatus Eisenbacteria bacterium]|uniref:O-antigen ligase family protein n=1 Tax=Eiseniibacteriota bacterium TaxID=2212470 RepID=A0ABV6YP14_UNCEI
MRNLVDTVESRRLPITFFILAGLSVLVGAMMGLKSPFGNKLIFYMIVIFNMMMITYLVLLKNMTWGVLIYLYALVFLNMYWRITIPGRLPDLDIPRMTFAFVWLIFLMEMALGNRKLLPRTNIEVAMLGVLGALLYSMFFVGQAQIRLFLNGFAIPYAMFVLAKNVFNRRKNVDRLVYWFAIPLSVYFPLNHFFEHFKIRSLVFPRYILSPEIAGKAVHFGERTIGVFLQPVATGMAMISMFLLALYGLSKLKGMLPRVMSWVLVAITPAAVFLALARSVYTGFALSLLIVLLFSKKLKVYALIILMGAGLVVLGNWSTVKSEKRGAGGLATTHTAANRLVLLDASFRMFADHPFVGVGFHDFQEHSLPYVRQVRSTIFGVRESWQGKTIKQHNHFLNMMTEVGLMGLLPQLLMFYFLFRLLYRARRIHDGAVDHDFVVVVWAILAEYLTNAMFMEPRFYEFMNVLPFLLAGIVVGSYQRKQLGNSLSPI